MNRLIKYRQPTTIYLVRHGDSEASRLKIRLPTEEDLLTPAGRCQARLLGKYLGSSSFTRAYSSDAPRASETAQLILGDSVNELGKLKVDSRIRAREMGIFVGQSSNVALNALEAALKSGISLDKYDVPGGESASQFDGRIDSFLSQLFKELRASEKPEKVLIVSHGVTILKMLWRLQNQSCGIALHSWSSEEVNKPMRNTSYHVLRIEFPPPPKKNNYFPEEEAGEDGQKIQVELLQYHQLQHLENLDVEGNEEEDYEEVRKRVEAGPLAAAIERAGKSGSGRGKGEGCATQ